MLQIAGGMLITVIVDQAKHAVSALLTRSTVYFALCFCLWTFPESKADGRTDGRSDRIPESIRFVCDQVRISGYGFRRIQDGQI